MAAPYQAVILAAGQGSRLHEHTKEIPKALLPIGPRSLDDSTETTFLRRQIELLHEQGVEQIVVVVGSLREMIEQDVSAWNAPVKLVVNPTPEISTSGSLHSFQFAAHSEHGILDGSKQTLMMDADIVYHRDALRLFLDSPEQSSIMISERFTGDNEEVLVYGSTARPRFLGKALTEALVSGEPCLGEATGVVKFAPADHALARETIDWMVGDPGAPSGTPMRRGYGPAGRATEHEELSQRFMRYGRIVGVHFDESLPFMECDDAAEYRRMRESFYPRLLELEART